MLRPAIIIGLLNVFMVCSPAFAIGPHALDLGVSVMSYQMNRLAGSETGDPSLHATSFFHLGIQYHLPITKQLFVSPVLRIMPIASGALESPEGGSRTDLSLLALPVLKVLGGKKLAWHFGAGPALVRYTIAGEGGTLEMNNGHDTAVFAKPARTTTSHSLALQLSAGASFTKAWSAGMDILTQAPGSNAKRSLSCVVSTAYSVIH